jgi:hypothetical protein
MRGEVRSGAGDAARAADVVMFQIVKIDQFTQP